MAIQKEKLRRTPPAKPGEITGEACACFSLQENEGLLDVALYVKDGQKVALRYRFFVREDEVRTWDEVNQRWTNADICSHYGERWQWNKKAFVPITKDACELVKKHFGECRQWETHNDKVRSALSDKVSHKEWEKRRRYIINKENRMEALIRQHLKQVPPMPKGFRRWVKRSLFRDRQYCFYETTGGRTRTGICSVCGHTMPAAGKRGEKVRCAACGMILSLRPKNGSQAVNRERVTVIQRLDGDVLLLRELDCEQAQGQDGRFETTVNHRHLHYVQPVTSNDNSLTLTTNLSICRYATKHRGVIWGIAQGDCEKKSVLCPLGVDAAIDGTSWARCAVKELGEGYAKRNIFNHLLKWKCVPAIEKLVKAGLKRFANECPHWKFLNKPNPTIYEMAKLGKESVAILRAMDGGDEAANVLRMLEKKNRKLNREELLEYMSLGVGPFLSDTILEHYGAKEATVYLKAQRELHKDKKMPDIARAWVDIRRLAAALGVSMRNRKMKFPADCVALHDELTDKMNQRQRRENRRKELQRNRQLTGAIRAVAKSMAMMAWEKDGLQIRAIASLPELYDEGTALGHCVGGYGQAIADGRSIIFVVRKTGAPKEPYFTAEVARGALTQLRGKKNCVPPADVKKFVDAWFKRVYLKKAIGQQPMANAG